MYDTQDNVCGDERVFKGVEVCAREFQFLGTATRYTGIAVFRESIYYRQVTPTTVAGVRRSAGSVCMCVCDYRQDGA